MIGYESLRRPEMTARSGGPVRRADRALCVGREAEIGAHSLPLAQCPATCPLTSALRGMKLLREGAGDVRWRASRWVASSLQPAAILVRWWSGAHVSVGLSMEG